eukprot:g31100.t1
MLRLTCVRRTSLPSDGTVPPIPPDYPEPPRTSGQRAVGVPMQLGSPPAREVKPRLSGSLDGPRTDDWDGDRWMFHSHVLNLAQRPSKKARDVRHFQICPTSKQRFMICVRLAAGIPMTLIKHHPPIS